MSKNVQTTIRLHSFHMLVRLCSKSYKLGFSSIKPRFSRCTSWVQKRQRNQRSDYQHQVDHRKGKEIPEKHLFCFTEYAKAFDSVHHNKLWKILKEIGIPGHLTCFLRNLYAGQEATVRTGHGTTDWFKIGKGVHQVCILLPCLFNFYAEYIM